MKFSFRLPAISVILRLGIQETGRAVRPAYQLIFNREQI